MVHCDLLFPPQMFKNAVNDALYLLSLLWHPEQVSGMAKPCLAQPEPSCDYLLLLVPC